MATDRLRKGKRKVTTGRRRRRPIITRLRSMPLIRVAEPFDPIRVNLVTLEAANFCS
jgi:hypothetical protein